MASERQGIDLMKLRRLPTTAALAIHTLFVCIAALLAFRAWSDVGIACSALRDAVKEEQK